LKQEHRNWFITGVSGGLGKALAQAALARGDSVAGTVRQVAQLAEFSALAPGRAFAYVLDVTDFERVPQVMEKAVADLGSLDVLVNNAGYGLVGSVEEVSWAQANHQMATNFFGPMALIRAALPYLRRQRRGHIVNISSGAGIMGVPGLAVYNASKFALEGLSEGLAHDLKPLGIKVTIIGPGGVRTDWSTAGLQRGENLMPEYAASSGERLSAITGNAGKQVGDPAKMAMAILAVVDAEKPPLRLALGEDGLALVRYKLSRLSKDADAWEAISKSTSFD